MRLISALETIYSTVIQTVITDNLQSIVSLLTSCCFPHSHCLCKWLHQASYRHPLQQLFHGTLLQFDLLYIQAEEMGLVMKGCLQGCGEGRKPLLTLSL